MSNLSKKKLFFRLTDDDVRCVGRLSGQTGRFRVNHISKVDMDAEQSLIERLEAISNFELAQFK